MRSAVAGLGALTACAVASAVLSFGTTAPLAVVLLFSAALGALVSAVGFFGLVRPLEVEATAARTVAASLQHQFIVANSRRGFLEQLDDLIDEADTEDEAIEIVGRALATVLPDRENAVLLAPPTGSRVTWMIEADASGLGAPVILDEPMSCGALAARHATRADSSEHPDACAHLATHGLGVSSLCVPILVGAQHLGVAHSAGPEGDLPDDEAIRLIEIVCRRVGAHIVSLRAARRLDYTLPLDTVTQLPTHTLVFREISQLRTEGSLFSVAVCDLDGLGAYNDAYGNEAGDAALRTFADVLSATLRPTDLIARYEGDRFVCLFPNTAALSAAAAMERVRESLILHTTMSDMAPFSASVGIVASVEGDTSEELVDLALSAVATAKFSGGNLVVCTESLDAFA